MGGFRTGALGFTSWSNACTCWCPPTHQSPGKVLWPVCLVTSDWSLWDGTEFSLLGQGPYHCVARPAPDPEATYLFLFNSMSFFFLLTLSAYIIRQLSCCILLRRFNCWGQMNKACIIESMGVDAWVFYFFCCIFFHELSNPMMIGQFSLLGPKLVPLGCSTKLKREIYFLFFHANFLLLYLIC
jgi:hypothetical protein